MNKFDFDPEVLQKLGAEARARGESQFQCYLYDPPNMPKSTGESLQQWQAKINAWMVGWIAEDLLISRTPVVEV